MGLTISTNFMYTLLNVTNCLFKIAVQVLWVWSETNDYEKKATKVPKKTNHLHLGW